MCLYLCSFFKKYNKLAKYLHGIKQFRKWKKVHMSTMKNTKNVPINTLLIDDTCTCNSFF